MFQFHLSLLRTSLTMTLRTLIPVGRNLHRGPNCRTKLLSVSELKNREFSGGYHLVTEFYLFVPTSSAFFQFSPEVFESRLLTVLYLIYCNIDEDDSQEFHCLKKIYFDHVSISRTTFSHFINKCPSIVELTLIDCFYLYSILVCPNSGRF